MNDKTLFVIGKGVYPHVVGGMEIFNYYLIRNISHKAEIACLATNKYDFDNIEHIRSFNLRPAKLLFPLQVFFCLLTHKFARIVYSYSSAHWFIWWSLAKMACLFKIPYIVVLHYGKKPPVDNIWAYRYFFASAEHVIAVSDDIKRNFDSQYGISCDVIPPLVPFEEANAGKDELRNKYHLPTDAAVICMVGSIKPMKNPDTLLDAVAKMDAVELSRLNPHIVYAGTGNMVAQLKQKAMEYDIDERVHFLGFVPKKDVNEVMKLSDIYVIASDFEGTSVSLLEAMYNGKMIIASDAPGIKDTINKGECLMFPTKDAVALKKAIVNMLDDHGLQKQLAANARLRYQKSYNYNNVISDYLTMLNC